jgi:hypothetical protein
MGDASPEHGDYLVVNPESLLMTETENKIQPSMRFGFRFRIDPFDVVLGLYVGTLGFRVLSDFSALVSQVQLAGVVAVVVWVVASQNPGAVEWALDRRAYLYCGLGTIGVWPVVAVFVPTAFRSHVPFWLAVIVAGAGLLITGQRRHARLLRDRNRVHERVSGRRSRWTTMFWTIAGGAIGIVGIKVAFVGPNPIDEFLQEATPIIVGTAIGGVIGHLLVDHSNAVELLVLDEALVVVVPGRWGAHPIDWRRVRTVELEDETLHVRTALWSSSFHCDLSDVERPRETVRALRDRAGLV